MWIHHTCLLLSHRFPLTGIPTPAMSESDTINNVAYEMKRPITTSENAAYGRRPIATSENAAYGMIEQGEEPENEYETVDTPPRGVSPAHQADVAPHSHTGGAG